MLIVLILSLAIVLAIRNARTGRADRRLATRLAVAMSLVVLTSGVLESRVTLSLFSDFPKFVRVAIAGVNWATLMGLLMWTFYTALEPYARRRWPQMLISWSRLLEGRWRDPLIGRDLLIGSVIGIADGLANGIYDSLKATPDAPAYAEVAWMGLGRSFAHLLEVLTQPLWLTLGSILLLVGLRIVLRTERLAMIAFVSVFAIVGFSMGENSVQDALGVIPAMISGAIFVLVATRFGLIAVLAMMEMDLLVAWSGASLTPPPPLVGSTVLAIIAMLAPGVFGLYTSRARRSSATAKWLDE